MTPEAAEFLRQYLPEAEPFHYYRDRESAWLLQAHFPRDTSVRDIRQGPFGKLLDRPLIKPLTAAGDGVLRHEDLRLLARADSRLNYDALSPAGYRAVEAAYDVPWLDFEVTYDSWGHKDWRWAQMSRAGAQLVVQLGFPSDHGELLQRTVGAQERSKFECNLHPIRHTGRPTLAWSRLDIDRSTKTALIEEVQSDWLRYVRARLRDMEERKPRARDLRLTRDYEAALTARYEHVWSRALMLVVLVLLRDALGIRDVFMHQSHTGKLLKWIHGASPPSSLYSALPKSFCFVPTREVPEFLRIKRRKHLRSLPKDKPLFWKMTF
jgi:hypothetical protein